MSGRFLIVGLVLLSGCVEADTPTQRRTSFIFDCQRNGGSVMDCADVADRLYPATLNERRT